MVASSHIEPYVPSQILVSGTKVDLAKDNVKDIRKILSHIVPHSETFSKITRKITRKESKVVNEQFDDLAEKTQKAAQEVKALRDKLVKIEKDYKRVASTSKASPYAEVEVAKNLEVYRKKILKKLIKHNQRLFGSMQRLERLQKACEHTDLQNHKSLISTKIALKTIKDELRDLTKFKDWEGHKLYEAKKQIDTFYLKLNLLGANRVRPLIPVMEQTAENLKKLILDSHNIDDTTRLEAIKTLRNLSHQLSYIHENKASAGELDAWIDHFMSVYPPFKV